jgi:hypothetical protein
MLILFEDGTKLHMAVLSCEVHKDIDPLALVSLLVGHVKQATPMCKLIIERHGHKPRTIPSTTSLYHPLQLGHDGVRFIDSWNFITIPLAKFGKCYGPPQRKTDFPVDSTPRIISSIDVKGVLRLQYICTVC